MSATIDITNLDACVADARAAALDQDPGPSDPVNFHALRGRLQAIRPRLPATYQDVAFDPYVTALNDLGEAGFQDILIADPNRESAAGLVLDVAHALLQRGEGFEPRALPAFQEVVSDLYDGFLSAEDRSGVLPPDEETVAPLVKYGQPSFGPYTFTIDATKNLGLAVGVVSVPPSNARRGLLAWAALGHETAGHDILHADHGLLDEVATAVRRALLDASLPTFLASYWSTRIDETASDVLGILNMGPAPGIGLIGYFRGLGNGHLRNIGPAGDSHPADILRGYLAASTVRLLEFTDAKAWGDAIENETRRDLGTIILAGREVTEAMARRSAEIVATTIVTHPFASLEQHAFGEIQNWRDHDEGIVDELRAALTSTRRLSDALDDGIFAAHLVAAATTSALRAGANIASLFVRMIDLLAAMHAVNPTFGRLAVRHQGDLQRHLAYIPTDAPALPAPIRVAS